MFERLIQRLRGAPHETELPPEDARHAMGALLVQVARADNAYLFEEIEQIDRILAAREKCSALEAVKMRARCEKLAEALPGTAQLTAIITRDAPLDEREAMFRAMWQVLLADGVRDRREEDYASEAGALLGLAPEQAARLIAEFD